MAEQSADHLEAYAICRSDAGKAVPQVVQPQIMDLCRGAYIHPRLAQRHDWLVRRSPGENVSAGWIALDVCQHPYRSVRQIDRFGAGLAVGKQEQPAVEMDMRPL